MAKRWDPGVLAFPLMIPWLIGLVWDELRHMRPEQRRGCFGCLGLVGLPLVVVLLGLCWWYRSDGDLDALVGDPAMPPAAWGEPATAEQAAALRALTQRLDETDAWPELFGRSRVRSNGSGADGEGATAPAEFWARLHRDALAAAGGAQRLTWQEADADLLHGVLCRRITEAPVAGLPGLVGAAVAVTTIARTGPGSGLARNLIATLRPRAGELRVAPATAMPVAGELRRLRERLWRSRGDPATTAWYACLALYRERVVGLDPPAGKQSDSGITVLRQRVWQRLWRAGTLRRIAADWRETMAADGPADLRRRTGRLEPSGVSAQPLGVRLSREEAAQRRGEHDIAELLLAVEDLDRLIAELSAPAVEPPAVEAQVELPAVERPPVEPAAVEPPAR